MEGGGVKGETKDASERRVNCRIKGVEGRGGQGGIQDPRQVGRACVEAGLENKECHGGGKEM
jgi:hypothetical protein